METSIKLVKGIGISTEGIHPRNHQNPAYKCWALLLERCYVKGSRSYKKYETISVCETWLDFQSFADWYTEQKGAKKGWELDKDLIPASLGEIPIVYSPETCVLLPSELNKCFKHEYKRKDKLPKGVYYARNKNAKYTASFRVNNTLVHLGSFMFLDDAVQKVESFKLAALKVSLHPFKQLLCEKALEAFDRILGDIPSL